MSKALPWKLPKDVLSGDQRGRKPIEQSPVVANHVMSSTMNDGAYPQPKPQPQPDQPGQISLLANAAGTTSAHEQPAALAPLPAQNNISEARKADQQTRRRRSNRRFSNDAEVHAIAAATSVVVAAAPDDQMEPPGPLQKKSNDDPELAGKEGRHDHQQQVLKKDKEVVIVGGSSDDHDHHQVITKDDFVKGFMNLRPRNKGPNIDDHKNGFIDFSLSLSKKEIEEDFLAMTGQKPPRRPTLKRPHAVQKRINKLFPGLDLDLVCPQAYAVNEKETAGKRI